MPTPYDITIPLFAPNGIVRPGTRLNSVRPFRAITIVDVVAWLYGADNFSANPGEIRVDLKMDSASILSSPVRIVPGQLHSKIAGTVQPVLTTTNVAAMQELVPDILAYGAAARGLCVGIVANLTE